MLSHYIKVIVIFRKFLNFDFRMYYSFFNDKFSVFLPISLDKIRWSKSIYL